MFTETAKSYSCRSSCAPCSVQNLVVCPLRWSRFVECAHQFSRFTFFVPHRPALCLHLLLCSYSEQEILGIALRPTHPHMSRLRPFNRELRSTPDASEPQSFEESQSYMDQVAEDFHNQFSRREVQNSFWRTPSDTDRSAFTSYIDSPEIGSRASSGLLRNVTGTASTTSVKSEISESFRSPKVCTYS